MNPVRETYIGLPPKILLNGSSNISINNFEHDDVKTQQDFMNPFEEPIQQVHKMPVIYISNEEDNTTRHLMGSSRRPSTASRKMSRHLSDSDICGARKASVASDLGSSTGRSGSSGKRSGRRRSSAADSRSSSRRHSRVKHHIVLSPEEIEKEKRHRLVVYIVMGTFIFIVMASVLVVVITLTSHKPKPHDGLHTTRRYNHQNVLPDQPMRKENEELMHSLNRDALNFNNHAHNNSKLLSTIAPETNQ